MSREDIIKNWEIGPDNVDLAKIQNYTQKILQNENPYTKLIDNISFPSEYDLVNMSSILNVRPELKTKTYAAEIAWAEFWHYIAQTYYFEVLGFQIIGDTLAHARDLTHIHNLASQSIDEARHIQVYSKLLQNLPLSIKPALCLPRIHKKIISESTLEEKIIKGFLVLEGLAIGLFAARSKTYGASGLSALDRAILTEETEHQISASEITADLVRARRVTLRDVIECMRDGTAELTSDLLPVPIVERFGIDLDDKKIEMLKRTGIVGLQANVSKANLKKILKSCASLKVV